MVHNILKNDLKTTILNQVTDYGFKHLFGREESRPALIDLLNALLKRENRIVEIIYLKTEQLSLTEHDRNAVFDIFCQEEKGNVFIIEMQQIRQHYFKARSLFYSMFPISNQGQRGSWDFNLKKTCTICFMDFNFDNTHPDQLIHHVKLIDTRTREVFSDLLEFLYVEMPKFKKKENELITREDAWLFILNNLTNLNEIPLILADDIIFKQFFMDAEQAHLTGLQLHAYYLSRKAKWDEYAIKKTASIEGRKEGKREGALCAKQEVAKAMKEMNEPLEKIIKYTGLSIEEIGIL